MALLNTDTLYVQRGSEKYQMEASDIIAYIANNSLSGTPPGTIITFASAIPPTGYLKCDGSIILRSSYANLFSAIGDTWGPGDGSTTFAVPDLRGLFIRSWDDSRGIDTGRAFATFQEFANASHAHSGATGDQQQNHNHSYSGSTSGETQSHYHQYVSKVDGSEPKGTGQTDCARKDSFTADTSANIGAHSHTYAGITVTEGQVHNHAFTTSASGDIEARPRNISLLYCIKF